MYTDYVRKIVVDSKGKSVYLETKSNMDKSPYRLHLCLSLSFIYRREGQIGLDREIVRLICECFEIRGNHWSVARYKPCLLARERLGIEHNRRLDEELCKLTPEDLETQKQDYSHQTELMREYCKFSLEERDRYYAELAGCAAPLPKDMEAPEREDNGAR